MLLALPVVFAVGCIDSQAPAPDTSELPTTPITFDELHVGDQTIVIATGGTQTVSIANLQTIGFSGGTTSGFELEPFAGIWPNVRKQEYRVRAVSSEQTGTFSIQTNKGIAAGPVDSAEVVRIALVPANYQLDGHSSFALDIAHPVAQVALFDATDRRLVDSTLAADVAQSAWDTVALPATVGTATIHVTADSFAAQTLTIALADQVDRVEPVTADGRTCFHAYAGAVEVAKAMPLTGTPDPDFVNCQLP